MFNEKDKVKVDLILLSSILNYAGEDGLLNYLSITTYKRIINSGYVNYEKFKDYAFINSESKWIESMDKLVEMGLAVKNGTQYTTKTNKKQWYKFVEEKQKFCKKFNGYMHFDVTELYVLRNNKDLKDIIYLGIRDRVIKSKSISRRFIKELTGCSIYRQKQVEHNLESVYLEMEEHHIPVSDNEVKNNKLGDIPVFSGNFSPKHMLCVKSKKGNCKVVQLGNKVKVKNIRICSFERKKQKVVKPQSSLDSLNNPSKETGENQDWESFSMVIDTSGSSKSNKFRGILSSNDYRYSSWKDFKHYDINKVNVLNPDGSMEDLRSILSK
jgi:hypothetical protein